MITTDAVTPVPLAGDLVTGTGSTVIHAPYDHAELGRVPVLTPDDVDRAVRAARKALKTEPLPQWRRAEILDRAAAELTRRSEEFAVTIAREAAKPVRTARSEVERAVSNFRPPRGMCSAGAG